MAACFGLFLISPALGWWLPAGVSTHSWDVDYLFYVILAVTGFFFVLTEAILVVFMWKYTGQPGPKPPPRSEKSVMGKLLAPLTRILNNPHKVEMAWTIVPALILLWVAFAQVSTWADVKYRSRMQKLLDDNNKVPLQIAVSARQFEWRLRYPSAQRFQDWLRDKDKNKADFDSFAKNPHADDVHVVNELHLWT
jgi:cytochrome c oxidase subunit 2